MKLVLFFLLLFSTPAWALDFSKHTRVAVTPTRSHLPRAIAPGSLLARVTVYWPGGDHWSRRHQSATGTHLRAGHCAVDPKRIPYGSKLALASGETLVAVDTGSAVQSRRAARKAGHTALERAAVVIDQFFETRRQALAWAANHPLFLTFTILPPS